MLCICKSEFLRECLYTKNEILLIIPECYRMLKKIIEHKDLRIGYEVLGNSSTKIIALHGHGRSPKDFYFLQEHGQVFALDIFFHGNSSYPEERIESNPIVSKEFFEAFKALLHSEKIEKLHIVAFSQGGRFILSILPFIENQVLSIQLISPDGMDNNSFYNKMSRSKLARKLFRYFEEHPSRFQRFSFLAYKLKLMRPKVFKFVQKFSNEPETFSRASKTWRGFRLIQANDKALKSYLHNNTTRFKIIMGEHDQIIRTQQAKKFLKRIGKENALTEINCGHDFFGEHNKSLLQETICREFLR